MTDVREGVPPAQQYEYKIVKVELPADDDEITAQLNELGQQGWLLVFPTVVNEGRLWLTRALK